MINAIIQRFKSRTWWLAIFTVASSQLPVIREVLADNYTLTAFGLAVAIAALREVTDKPVSEK